MTFEERLGRRLSSFSIAGNTEKNMQKPLSVELVNEYGDHAIRVNIDGHSALLDATEVDGLIEELGKLRATIRPAVPDQPLRTHQYVIEIDPCWYAERHPMFEGAVMFLRHTGLGWTGFALPTESVHRLKSALNAMEAETKREAQLLPN
jgi:hypothetical protein